MKTTARFLMIILVSSLAACASKSSLAPMMYEYELSEAKSLIKANKLHQAIDELNMLIQMNPKHPEAIELRALSYQKLNRFDRAIEDYSRVLLVSKHAPKAHYNLAMIYAYKTNNRRKALSHFDRFLSLDPYHKEAFNVAKVMRTMDQEIHATLPVTPGMQVLLTEAEESKTTSEKRSTLKKGMEIAPKSPIFFYLMGKTYAEEGTEAGSKQAEKFFRLALERRPTSARCHRGLGELFAKVGKTRDSRIHMRKAELFDPKVAR